MHLPSSCTYQAHADSELMQMAELKACHTEKVKPTMQQEQRHSDSDNSLSSRCFEEEHFFLRFEKKFTTTGNSVHRGDESSVHAL